MFADYIVNAKVSSCSLRISVSVLPPDASITHSCWSGQTTAKVTHMFTCTVNVHRCESAKGGLTFTAPSGSTSHLAGIQRGVSIRLWKSANATAYPYTSKYCGRHPFTNAIVCR